MSVSISPWCLWSCAHRGGGGGGGGGAGESDSRGTRCIFVQHSLSPPSGLCTLTHPSSNLTGKGVGECNQDRRRGYVHLSTRKQGDG